MILKRLQVEGYKALRNPVELKDLGVGLHVIHGPNETGKSTLLWALARTFFDRYNSNDQEIRALRPWGTELAPRMSVEFESEGKLFKLEKRFLDEESSALSEWNGSRFERVADSLKADERVRAMLLGTPAKGASSLSHWGVARLLWLPQTPDRMNPPEVDESLRQYLVGVLGGSVLSERERKLCVAIDKAYDAFFTAAKQSEKKGSALSEARERLNRAQEALALWKSKWEEVSSLNEQVLHARRRLEQAQSELGPLNAQIKDLEARASEELKNEGLLKVKDEEVKRLQDRWKNLNAVNLEIQNLEKEVPADHARVLQELSGELQSLNRSIAEHGMKAEAKAVQRQLRELSERVQSARQIDQDKAKLAAEYQSRKRPQDADLLEAGSLLGEIDRLKSQMLELGIEVRVVAQAAVSLKWNQEDARSLGAGDEAVFRSADPGILTIPGVGEVRVRSGAQDSKSLRAKLEECERKLAAKWALFGVSGLDELKKLNADTKNLVSDGQALAASLKSTLTAQFQNVAAAEIEKEKLGLKLKELLSRLEMNEEALERLELEDSAALQTRLAPLKVQHEAALRAETLSKQLEGKLSAVGGRETLDRELRECLSEKNALETEQKILRESLPQPQDRASLKLAGLVRARDALSASESVAKTEWTRISAILESSQGDGYYSKLAAAEEEHALATRAFATQETRARGARTLRGLAHQLREQMSQGWMDPIDREVISIFDEIRGAKSESLKGLDLMSFGTQEQAMLAIRLAYGKLLSEKGEKAEPQLVVLDDPLVNADPIRQERAKELLKAASSKLQILIMTARPEDYRSLSPKEYDLAALKQ